MPIIKDERKNLIMEAFLRTLESGATFDKSCQAAGTNRTTIWKWRKENPEFDEKVNEVLDSRTQAMEDSLYNSGMKGNVVAQIFWLKNRSGGRWKDKQEIEHSGEMKLNKEEMDGLIDLTERAIKKLKFMPDDNSKSNQ